MLECALCEIPILIACPYNIAMEVAPGGRSPWWCPTCDSETDVDIRPTEADAIVSSNLCAQCPQYARCLTVVPILRRYV